jgi:hypothetical protein
MKTQELHCNPPLESKHTIIDNISLFYNLAKHYVSPIFAKNEAIVIVVKGLIMLRDSKSRKHVEETTEISC